MTIYDGSNSDSDIIKKMSGHLGSFGLSSSGNVMHIELKTSNNGYPDKGFLATYYYGKSYIQSSLG